MYVYAGREREREGAWERMRNLEVALTNHKKKSEIQEMIKKYYIAEK